MKQSLLVKSWKPRSAIRYTEEKNSSCKQIPYRSWQYGEILHMLEKIQAVPYIKEAWTNWKITFAHNHDNHKESSCMILNDIGERNSL